MGSEAREDLSGRTAMQLFHVILSRCSLSFTLDANASKPRRRVVLPPPHVRDIHPPSMPIFHFPGEGSEKEGQEIPLPAPSGSRICVRIPPLPAFLFFSWILFYLYVDFM